MLADVLVVQGFLPLGRCLKSVLCVRFSAFCLQMLFLPFLCWIWVCHVAHPLFGIKLILYNTISFASFLFPPIWEVLNNQEVCFYISILCYLRLQMGLLRCQMVLYRDRVGSERCVGRCFQDVIALLPF